MGASGFIWGLIGWFGCVGICKDTVTRNVKEKPEQLDLLDA